MIEFILWILNNPIVLILCMSLCVFICIVMIKSIYLEDKNNSNDNTVRYKLSDILLMLFYIIILIYSVIISITIIAFWCGIR